MLRRYGVTRLLRRHRDHTPYRMFGGWPASSERLTPFSSERVWGSVMLRADYSIWGATLTRDGAGVATWASDGSARLCDIGHDGWPTNKLTLRYEVKTGIRLTDFGEVEAITSQDGRALKNEYAQFVAKIHTTHLHYSGSILHEGCWISVYFTAVNRPTGEVGFSPVKPKFLRQSSHN